jgi:nitrogen fixation NifU-like protein
MSSLYTDIIQHAQRYPEHRGNIERPTHSFEEENPLCGDRLLVQLRVENGIIGDASFQGEGCVISQAAAELVLDRIIGEPVESVYELDRDAVLEELGLPTISPARLKCALLSLSTVRGALTRRG